MQRNRISTFGFSGLLILSMAAALAACTRGAAAREVLARPAGAPARFAAGPLEKESVLVAVGGKTLVYDLPLTLADRWATSRTRDSRSRSPTSQAAPRSASPRRAQQPIAPPSQSVSTSGKAAGSRFTATVSHCPAWR